MTTADNYVVATTTVTATATATSTTAVTAAAAADSYDGRLSADRRFMIIVFP